MRVNELLKMLQGSDCHILRHGKRHDIWRNPNTGKTFPVPRHGTQEVAVGTLKSILEGAGLK